ncbi:MULTISPECIES: GMC family oxidoreductase N-terminal domain-containing protein [Rhizobium]|uniref:GMC family oxidoreductase n=1 Tax=Rhizobium TaxID=379 RepID=UPI00103F7997|nr:MULTISPECIES: GMC family oxidoreductase N-terminal domain-containing protein [Rhizobium]MBX4911063.1 alanine-phosphoribitol ligase [Rhizobium bangladeshense]MBX5177180.1 alanine-phosphoribitol ligase [Rhizobium lentis]MBX5253993.1 alanine-phosphoribitol ligase [Rhizobium sp. NLR4b]MBX5260180.1 alanine-phosphoribitol ligase [Rhizobium sp. NLR16b]MBX5266270.1 alanine-phosphoribitol ligase [Rhizobium sp. NLR16a]
MQTYDYIITGAGPAGCVLASRLTEDPAVRVLLVEAGGRDSHPFFRMPAGFAKMTKGIASWGWSTVPQRHMNDRVLWYTQAKVIGGGSTINAQIYTRGNALDYDAWRTEAGCKGWSYREVLPYFRRAEGNERFHDDYHGSEGPLGVSMPRATLPICDAFLRAAQQCGIPYNHDFNGRSQDGVGFYQLTQKNVARSSAATAFLRPAMTRSNLTVRTGSEVSRILVERGEAVGVEIVERSGGERSLTYAEREVLVTSGGIGSPRLLLLSGIGPADHLRSVGVDVVHDLRGVGENLQDHLDLSVISECSGDHSYDRVQRIDRTIVAGIQYLLFKSGPVASSLFETGGFWYADSTARSPDIQFHFGQGSGIEKGISKLDNPGVTLNSAFMRPRSRGTVRLANANLRAAPLIDPNYWSDPYDREMSLRGLEMAREIMKAPALKPFLLREALPGPSVTDDRGLFDFACRVAKTDHHPVGACKMGNDAMAVVSPELKVHGIEGLRVCDSSVMPLINSSNTNAPSIMIGEKASDLVRGLASLPPAVFEHERNERARMAR